MGLGGWMGCKSSMVLCVFCLSSFPTFLSFLTFDFYKCNIELTTGPLNCNCNVAKLSDFNRMVVN